MRALVSTCAALALSLFVSPASSPEARSRARAPEIATWWAADALPPGHPPIGAYALPPGHPPIDAYALPPGHPPIGAYALPPGHPPIGACPARRFDLPVDDDGFVPIPHADGHRAAEPIDL